MKDKSYADLLKAVKNTINPSDIGADIKEVRKTKNGELLLIVQSGPGNAEVLSKLINEKMPEVTASVSAKKKVLHIKDLDEVTTESDIREAICQSIAVAPETLDVRALRSAYGGKQNVTIVIKDEDADTLTHLRIGLTSCRIQERKIQIRCYKWWNYGHKKMQCNGPDREKLCLKCGREGHTANQCYNVAFCIHYNVTGQQSGSNTKCQQMRCIKKSNNAQGKSSTD